MSTEEKLEELREYVRLLEWVAVHAATCDLLPKHIMDKIDNAMSKKPEWL